MTDQKPIKDGTYGAVSGTVGRTFTAKNGKAFVIEITREGSQYPDRVTVWSADFDVSTGDRVSVNGWLGWRKTEKDGKTYVDVSLNKPQLKAHEKSAAPAGPAADSWASGSTDGAPF